MTIKGENGDKRVFSNLVKATDTPKVYKLKNCPGYETVNWSNLDKKPKSGPIKRWIQRFEAYPGIDRKLRW